MFLRLSSLRLDEKNETTKNWRSSGIRKRMDLLSLLILDDFRRQ